MVSHPRRACRPNCAESLLGTQVDSMGESWCIVTVMGNRVRIVHVINSFAYGGAEAMLCNLLLRTDTDRFEPSVVALIDDMSVAGPVLEARIPVLTIGMRPGIPDPRGIPRLP